MNRLARAALPTVALTKIEIRVLELLVRARSFGSWRPTTLGPYLTKLPD